MVKPKPLSDEVLNKQYIEGRRVTMKVYMAATLEAEIVKAAKADGHKTSAFVARIMKQYLEDRRKQKKSAK